MEERKSSYHRGQRSLELGGQDRIDSVDVEIEELIYESEDSGFCVVRVSPVEKGTPFRATGPLSGLMTGETARLRGRFIQHQRHGLQFEVESWEPIEPRTAAGIEKYLGSGLIHGVGKRLASSIVHHFGAESLQVICEKPHMLRQVRGVGTKLAHRIHKAVSARRTEAESLAFLQSYGMGPALARRVLAHFGEEAQSLLVSDPYRMASEIRGVGFRTADRIGREAGLELDAPVRVQAALLHVLREARDEGHVALPQLELAHRVLKLEVAPPDFEKALECLSTRSAVVSDNGLIYLPSLFHFERELALTMAMLATAPPSRVATKDCVEQVCRDLAPEQRNAVLATVDRRLVVITGGPGTGKTTALKAVVKLQKSLGRTVALASPTGRAARRLSEVTGYQAVTIHRLLEYSPAAGFQRGSENPLDTDLVVVDEASMLDVPLAYRLVKALPEGASLLLVGDVDQLPSVGVGSVLNDLITSQVATVKRLNHIFRQAAESGIVVNAHRVNHGEAPQSTSREDGDFLSDFHVIRAEKPERALQLLTRLVCERIPAAYGLDSVKDVQVLAPMHRGSLGCQAINECLRQNLGLMTGPTGLRGFRKGDKVMQIRNDYEREVFNGDIGRVLDTRSDGLTLEIDGRHVEYDAKGAEDLTLAYCITVHKAQGSEYPAVVMVLHTQHHIMLARNLLYTAITRGRRLVVLIGSPKAMAQAARTDRLIVRHGRLKERLQKATARKANL